MAIGSICNYLQQPPSPGLAGGQATGDDYIDQTLHLSTPKSHQWDILGRIPWQFFVIAVVLVVKDQTPSYVTIHKPWTLYSFAVDIIVTITFIVIHDANRQ